MDSTTKESIKSILRNCVSRAFERTFNENKAKDYKPFHEALLSNKIIIASSFERSFSTSFGQGPIEEISMKLAQSTGADSKRQYRTQVNINQGAIDEIERILSALDSNDSKPNWARELERVTAFKKGSYIVRDVISDLWIQRGSQEIFISIKTVKPNKDQTLLAKKNMLLLKAHNYSYQTYFSLFYNPNGPDRADYNWAIPFKFFAMKTDPCVLIGEEYWDFLGGKGTYIEMLKLFEEVGAETQEKFNNTF